MEMFRKLSLLLVVLFILELMPLNLLGDNFVKTRAVKAASVLSREDFKKFQGMIAAGGDHSVILNPNGTVDAVGYNNYGQLSVDGWTNIVAVSAGVSGTVGLKNDGTVESAGYDIDIQTKLKSWTDMVFVTAGGPAVVGIKSDGTVESAGGLNSEIEAVIGEWTNITDVSTGGYNLAGLKSDGTVVAVGYGLDVQRDIGGWKDIVDVSSGRFHTVGLKSDGTVLAVGNNSYGQTNVSNWTDIVAVSAGGFFTAGLKSDGTVVAVGDNYYNQINTSEWTNIVAISAGEDHLLGLRSNGEVLAIGENTWGQINVFMWEDMVDVSGGFSHTVGIKNDGTVRVVGRDEFGATNVSGWTNIVDISAGVHHTAGLKSDGTVVAVGGNNSGEINVSNWMDIISVDAGYGQTVGLKKDGTGAYTGISSDSPLNPSIWTNMAAVDSGGYFTLFLTRDGQVRFLGSSISNENDISYWEDIISVAAGRRHAVGLKNDRSVVAVGESNYGQINVSDWRDIVAIAAGYDHTVGLKSDGTVVAVGRNSVGQLNVGGWKDIVAVAAGDNYTLGIKKDGTVLSAGYNNGSQTSWCKNLYKPLVSKGTVKPGETIKIKLSAGNFYNITNPQISLSGGINIENAPLNKINEGEYEFSYTVKPEESGAVNAVLSGVTDIFGNSLTQQDLFRVIPLISLDTSKTTVNSGENIKVTATFNEGVKPGIRLSLNGSVFMNQTNFVEVPGSNGTKYEANFNVPKSYIEGSVSAVLYNIETNSGELYCRYPIDNLFDNRLREIPLKSLTTSKYKVKTGDEIVITAEFNEIMKKDFNIVLSGANWEETMVMRRELNSGGKGYSIKYTVQNDMEGPVNVKLLNVYDYNGLLCQSYNQNSLFEIDNKVPEMTDLSISSPVGKLGDKLKITATFSEAIKPGVKLSLAGGTNKSDLLMTEVSGSAGTKYEFEYLVEEGDLGKVSAVIKGIEDFAGNLGADVIREQIFELDGVKPRVVSLQSDYKTYTTGDYALIKASFDDSVKPGVKLVLTGAINNEEYEMQEVQGSGGKEYILSYEVKAAQSGYVNATVKNAQDSFGNTADTYSVNGIFGMNIKAVTGVALDKSQITLGNGQSITLTAKINPTDATNKNVTWSSSSPSVASVDQTGKVTALSSGSTIITVTTIDGGYSAVCNITVQQHVESVTLNLTTATINKGQVKQLTATVLPVDAVNKNVVWSSTNPSVAAVDQSGKVTALEKGSATIKVTTVDGGKTAECNMVVTAESIITPTRYGGTSRFETAVKVSASGWTTSESVVLVNAYGFADALTGVPFAYIKNGPILLTEKDSIPDATDKEMVRLKAKNVYILGGTGVVSQRVEEELKSKGLKVYRTAGTDRFNTAIQIANEVMKNNPTKTAVLTTAYNYPDALAISSYAALNKYPILYTDPVGFNQKTRDFLKQYGITKVIIPGGTGAVSESIANELRSKGITLQRIAGVDRYSTALNIVKTFKSSFKNDIMLATGENFPDALAGGVLAAKKQIPILLVEQNSVNSEVSSYIRDKGTINMYILGGSGVISDNIVKMIKN